MNWAWEQQLPPVPKLTLLALADNADDHGYCWPKMRTIATKCCTSERTIQRTIKSLLGTGLLHKAARFDGSGRQVSNSYTLALSYPDKLSPPSQQRGGNNREGVASVTPGTTELCHGGSDAAMSPLEPPHEPSKESSTPGLAKITQLKAEERLKLARLISEVPTDQQEAITALLVDALTKGAIQTSPSRWLKAVIRRKGYQSTAQAVPELSEAAYVERLIQGGIAAEDALQIARQTFSHRITTKHAATKAAPIPQGSMKTGWKHRATAGLGKATEKNAAH
ncbi:Helix-turn-helix domain-containing protein [Pseudomonas jinjuensis]|uniref:Helix-turn-helix domain-containing protein n=2 Tax=Pseudomonas jinjuensis TaxID=198616 RepID=A0A1H0IXP0_9PSED|nr:Helix-turn-helix domain-containing protein [Pseudomonas jinjuensis]